ncbi:hypothetical protein AAVH_26456, partial [Aphelenchoides avenae]
YLVFGGGYMFLVSNGYFAGQSGFVDRVSMAVFCALLHVNIIIVVMQFVWRNSITCGNMAFTRVTKGDLRVSGGLVRHSDSNVVLGMVE